MKPHQKLHTWLKTSKCNGILVTKPESIGYLTQFWGSFGVYLQTPKGRWLLTDGRYQEVAQKLAKANGFELVIFTGEAPEKFIKQVSGPVWAEDSMTIAEFKRYRRWFKNCKLKGQYGAIENLRKVKAPEELQIMRDAQSHVDKMLVPFLQQHLRAGVTELELKFKLDQALQNQGQYGLSFDSIVGFGPGSALPHYTSGNRKLETGQNILIDCGVIDRKYCSDMTRNFVFGTADPEYLKDYEALLSAQCQTLKKVKAGIKAKSLDTFCRKKMGELAPLFAHSLGHGVGLEIHEAPTLSPRSKDTLQLNEVVTVEPGIYRPGQYGIRIEDCVIVGADDCEILTKTTKDLLSFNEFGEVQPIIKAP